MKAQRLYERMLQVCEDGHADGMLCQAFSRVMQDNYRDLFKEINDLYYNSLFKAIDKSPHYRGFKKWNGSWFHYTPTHRQIRIDVLKEAIRLENRLTNGK